MAWGRGGGRERVRGAREGGGLGVAVWLQATKGLGGDEGSGRVGAGAAGQRWARAGLDRHMLLTWRLLYGSKGSHDSHPPETAQSQMCGWYAGITSAGGRREPAGGGMQRQAHR